MKLVRVRRKDGTKYLALLVERNPRHPKNPIEIRRQAIGYVERARSQVHMAAEAMSQGLTVVSTGDPEAMEMAAILQFMRRLERSVDQAAKRLRRR